MKSKAITRWLRKRLNQILGQPDVDILREEIKRERDTLQRTREQHAALTSVIGKIRAALDLDSLFATSQETCQLLQVERVAIHISDNGAGIPEALQQRLFDPFFTTKSVGKGTGLGLSISYQIITEKHNGKLVCYSEPGQGTEFIIELPIHQTRVRA